MAEILKNDWFYEYFTGNAKFGIKIKDHFIDTRSEFQKIDFYDSYADLIPVQLQSVHFAFFAFLI